MSPIENEHTEQRRPHVDNGRRRRAHFRQDSHSDSSASEEGDSTSSSESGNSTYENDSGTCTPKLDPRPLRYQLPSRWCTVHKTEKTELSDDDLQVRYTVGAGKVDQDASAIRANRPIPPQCGIYYFEVYIKSKGEQGYIGVGVCNPLVPLDRLPGWEPQSWGYHGDDGNSFGGCGSGRPFGPVFTTGDTIGCGVNFRDMSLFYTKNGVYLGIAFRDLKGLLFPTVGMRTAGEIIEANFGQRGFVFNIDDYQAWQTLEAAFQKATAKLSHLPSLPQSTSQLVLSYLIHHGYSESAKQLSSDLALQSSTHGSDNGSTSSTSSASSESSGYPPAILDAERRQAIRQSILTGDIDKAIELLELHYPGVMTDEDIVLQLQCRKFIEMVNSESTSFDMLDHPKKQGEIMCRTQVPHDTEMVASDSGEQMDIDHDDTNELEDLGPLKTAFQFGRSLYYRYKDNRRPSVQDMLKQTFAILAHIHSTHHGSERLRIADTIPCEKVASSVNTAILASLNLPTTAPLETLYQQTNVTISELTRLGVGEAAFLDCTN
ncbi:MAG: concanavalin A-like lectin/glucanase domain-containing protein [Benniella sp.]|nr:MAG: concanavalin A-like lectin/glucanase domain-containing protein [Benniella sp.]